MDSRRATSPSAEPPALRLEVARRGDGTVLSVAGEVDLATVAELDAAARERLAAGPLLLDLGAVTFLDSSGVRLLDALLRDADAHGWSLVLRDDLRPAVREVLELTGMLAGLPFEGASGAGAA